MEYFKELFGESWYNQLSPYFNSIEFQTTGAIIGGERLAFTIYPETPELVFRAFRETPFEKVRVVVLGQDPYHDGSADGLPFSNGRLKFGQKPSPSLKFIMREVLRQMTGTKVGEKIPIEALDEYVKRRRSVLVSENQYDLTHWARQGVFMLNTALTVRQGQPLSHQKLWEPFTKYVLHQLVRRKLQEDSREEGLIFLLWGEKARGYRDIVNSSLTSRSDRDSRHTVLTCGHPVTAAYNFKDTWTGNSHFTETNSILRKWYGPDAEIIW